MITDGTDTFRVYTKPNYSMLGTIADELGVNLTLDPSIREAQRLFGKLKVETKNGHTPKEYAYIKQLLPAALKQDQLPPELQVYLVDREYLHVPETIDTRIFRETARTRRDFFEAVDELGNIAREQEKR